MFCPQCGKPLQETDNFCVSCGRSLKGADNHPDINPALSETKLKSGLRGQSNPDVGPQHSSGHFIVSEEKLQSALKRPRSEQLAVFTKKVLKIVLLAMFWFTVPFSFLSLTVIAYSEPQWLQRSSRASSMLGFYSIFGTGILCALHAKRYKAVWFFWGSIGGLVGSMILIFIAALMH